MSYENIVRQLVRLTLPVLILGAGVVVFWSLVTRPKAAVQSPKRLGPPTVETVIAMEHNGILDVQVDGLVVPYREIVVAAEVAGRLAFKAETCRAGKYVTEATPLIRIDPYEYQLTVRRLEKELEQADAYLKELSVELVNVESLIEIAREDVALQRKELSRTEQLVRSGVVTDSQIDQERRNMLAARNNLTARTNERRLFETRRNRLLSGQELVKANLEKAHLDLERTNLEAPVTGVIVEDVVEEGTYVQPGQMLYMIEDTSAVEVQCALRMEQLVWLRSKQSKNDNLVVEQSDPYNYQISLTPATVVYELDGKNYTWQGTLSRFDGIGLDEKTRMVPCRVIVSAPRQVAGLDGIGTDRGPRALVRGMYVTIVLHAQSAETLLAVPERAIRPGNRIWRVDGGKLSIDQVEVIHVQDGNAILLSRDNGVKAGDAIVTSPLAGARAGIAVEIFKTLGVE